MRSLPHLDNSLLDLRNVADLLDVLYLYSRDLIGDVSSIVPRKCANVFSELFHEKEAVQVVINNSRIVNYYQRNVNALRHLHVTTTTAILLSPTSIVRSLQARRLQKSTAGSHESSVDP